MLFLLQAFLTSITIGIILIPRVLLYQNNLVQHSWFIRMDIVKLSKFPSWFSQWISYFEREIHFLPSYMNKKYELFFSQIDKNIGNPFYQYHIYYKLPWLLSWNFSFHYHDNFNTPLISSLVHKVFIRWWDMFNSLISLDFLPKPSVSQTTIFTAPVALATKNIPSSKM